MSSHHNDHGLLPLTTSYPAARRAMGLALDVEVALAVAKGTIRAAEPTPRGRLRIDVSSLLEAGIPAQAVLDAETRTIEYNRRKNAQRAAAKKSAVQAAKPSQEKPVEIPEAGADAQWFLARVKTSDLLVAFNRRVCELASRPSLRQRDRTDIHNVWCHVLAAEAILSGHVQYRKPDLSSQPDATSSQLRDPKFLQGLRPCMGETK